MSWLRLGLAAIVCLVITTCLSGCFLPRFVPTDENVVGTWTIDAEGSNSSVLRQWGGADGQIVLNSDHTFEMVGVPGAIFSVFEKSDDVSERSGEWIITGKGRSTDLTLVSTYTSDGAQLQASPTFRVSDGQLMMVFEITEDIPNALILVKHSDKQSGAGPGHR